MTEEEIKAEVEKLDTELDVFYYHYYLVKLEKLCKVGASIKELNNEYQKKIEETNEKISKIQKLCNHTIINESINNEKSYKECKYCGKDMS